MAPPPSSALPWYQQPSYTGNVGMSPGSIGLPFGMGAQPHAGSRRAAAAPPPRACTRPGPGRCEPGRCGQRRMTRRGTLPAPRPRVPWQLQWRCCPSPRPLRCPRRSRSSFTATRARRSSRWSRSTRRTWRRMSRVRCPGAVSQRRSAWSRITSRLRTATATGRAAPSLRLCARLLLHRSCATAAATSSRPIARRWSLQPRAIAGSCPAERVLVANAGFMRVYVPPCAHAHAHVHAHAHI